MEYNDKFDNKLMESHDYDGIKELDNNPPSWLMAIFWVTIFFSAIYFSYYNFFGQGDTQQMEYDKEVADAKAKIKTDAKADNKGGLNVDETNVVLLTDSVSLSAGKQLFAEKICLTCHGKLGEGNNIGPNLTDEYWIQGGKPNDVFKIIKYGNPTKGMTPFKDQLSDEKILQLASFVLIKLKGSNPPNPKAPQGDKN